MLVEQGYMVDETGIVNTSENFDIYASFDIGRIEIDALEAVSEHLGYEGREAYVNALLRRPKEVRARLIARRPQT